MESGLNEIMAELKFIRNELHVIKENMPDREMFLTSEENQLLHESYKNEKKGKLISSKDVLQELGL